jgi:hypothetical protein
LPFACLASLRGGEKLGHKQIPNELSLLIIASVIALCEKMVDELVAQ